jgi:hypothetical protein
MFVLVMLVVVDVLMGMHHGIMAVVMPVVDMGPSLVLMLVLMLIFVVATHLGSPPFYIYKNISASLHVKETPARYPAKKSSGRQNYPERMLKFSPLCRKLKKLLGTNPGIVLTNLKLDEPATKAFGATSARFLWLFFVIPEKENFGLDSV